MKLRWLFLMLAGAAVIGVTAAYVRPKDDLVAYQVPPTLTQNGIAGPGSSASTASGPNSTANGQVEPRVPQIDKAHLNRPAQLYIYEPVEIQLTIQGGAPPEEIEGLYDKLTGQRLLRTIKVGRYMSAKLSAPVEHADVRSVDESRREYTPGEPIIWRWFVTPKDTGPIYITVETYIHSDKTDGTARVIRVLREDWTAEARGIHWIKYQVNQLEPMRVALWTLAGSIASIFIFFGWTGWRKSGAQTTPAPPNKRVGRRK